ncbi:hypothetical protein HD553DRAFT_305840 [Filobasidium floriforme]|uniref:uncharacterized protein n=1 Tax=Filobasidium floriforme TaxID=5210 RepID=UPI001E8DBF1D|nr:uncharacterized protein HD553DRAFT_305840 [Filobasidium floriforme]KAH8089331.1 hypothetical protein HD553DRAFT_305840 [Filobasidium floriforme]
MQRRLALERQRQQQHERLEAELAYRQQVQEARQVAALRAIQNARQQAAEIEAAQARERRARQIQAQQQYFAQHQRAQEERQRQIKQREEEQRRLAHAQQAQQAARQSQAREQAFWKQFERCVATTGSIDGEQSTDLLLLPDHSACAPPTCRRTSTPATPAHSRLQAQAQAQAQARTRAQPEPKEDESISGFPVDILKMIFGPDVFVAQQTAGTQETGRQSASASQAQSQAATPKPATPVQAETKAAPSAPVNQEADKAAQDDVAQKFIDDLFGAFSHAFGLNDEDDEKEREEKKEDKPAAAQTKDEQPAQAPAAKPVEKAQTTTEEAIPETPAAPTEAPTPKTATEDDEVPVSAADLEAEKAQATADLIQAKYRQHLLRVTRLEKLEALENKLEKLDEGWTFPDKLDFLPEASHDRTSQIKVDAIADPVDSASSQSENLIVPPLAFTPTNVPYHAHAQALLGLLVAADAISSDGDEQVRNARREFVRTVEGKLGEMEVGRRRVWEKLRGKQVEEVKVGDEVKAEDHPATEEEQASIEENKPVEEDKEATYEATPIALPSQEPLPTTTTHVTEPSTEHDKPTEPTKSDESIEQATADIESTRPLEDVKAQSADDEDGDVEAGRAFSDSEDEDQKAEDEEKSKKEQVDEFVVV